jgi:hypothetical protein
MTVSPVSSTNSAQQSQAVQSPVPGSKANAPKQPADTVHLSDAAKAHSKADKDGDGDGR